MRKLIALLIAVLSLSLSGRAQSYIVISKDSLTLKLFASDSSLIKQYPIACSKYYGPKERKGDNKTPEGSFKINEILRSASLTHDFHDGKGPIKGAYGPYFMRLSVPGFIDIGIHGTHLPQSIGTRATEGCIRMRNEDVTDLRSRVDVGTPVTILPDTLK